METQTFEVRQFDESSSYMFKKTFEIDLSKLFENEIVSNSINGEEIKKDFVKYLKTQKDFSVFEQSFFALLWKIYAPLMTPIQLAQLELFVLDKLKQFYLFFCYNLYNLISSTSKTAIIPRKKRQLPLTHLLTRLHNFVSFETESVENYKFLINFLLAHNKD